ncbi:hypothetical protein OSB04_022122 [Centaurea solstitialis]|uniref:Alkaline/neutral invertase n=1 Tax=Centaurea solstitialis TaxID=347529 RepID=A0AA38SX54_9ASTR|nr:hypothetical protein OSB04_022122 [Centaurea solstitialis]
MRFGSRLSMQSRSFLGFIVSPILNRNLHETPPRFLGFPSINPPHKPFSIATNRNWGRSRIFPATCCCSSNSSNNNSSSKPNFLVNYSTTVETRVNNNNNNDKNFERVYVQGGGSDLDEKKTLVVETVDKDDEGGEESRLGGEKLGCKVEGDGVETEAEKEAWRLLKEAVVTYCGSPVGTLAANDPGDITPLNYDQVFIRDFVPSALAFLLKGEGEIVRNFLLHTLQLQSWEKTVDCYSPGQGLMPASFKIRTVPLDDTKVEEVLDPDFGESAIGRVAPVDSGLWWIILLRAYGKITGDYAMQERVDVQTGIKLILNLCLSDGFDMFPSLLVTDGSCMIDRRMGIHGHPLEIQSLFYSGLRCAREMLASDEGSKNLVRTINNRLSALSFHIREYYWIDMKKINEIYRYKTEEYSTEAINKFNIYPEQIPHWLMDWIPEEGGYMIGNLQPAHMDFRFFTLGNIWAIVSSLSTPKQNTSILNMIESKWDDLVGQMPIKICYPALELDDWRIITGSDPKNTSRIIADRGHITMVVPGQLFYGRFSKRLVCGTGWDMTFTLACLKMGREELARKAVDLAEKRLYADHWPEYYDTKSGKFIGKQARLYQTWTIAGFLTSKMLLENPEKAALLFWEEDYELLETCVCALSKTSRKKCSRVAAKSQILGGSKTSLALIQVFRSSAALA